MPPGPPIRVLVIDDCQTLRRFVLRALEGTGRFQVAGLADTGRGAASAVARHKPDVVLLDIQMPDVDGLVATREIMARAPTPIVIFCGMSEVDAQHRAFEALREGAVSLVPKPGPEQPLDVVTQELLRAVEIAAGVRPVARRAGRRRDHDGPNGGAAARGHQAPTVIGIGASTGGPPALVEVLRGLPADVPPILVVQHIVAGFVDSLVAWMGPNVPQRVVIASDGQAPSRGVVYVASTDGHLVLRDGVIAIAPEQAHRGHRPSVDMLFESLARDRGAAALGVLLTGMGDDGARGLRAMRDRGAETIAQDEASSVVYGMPRAAVELGGARRVLPLGAIADAIRAAAIA